MKSLNLSITKENMLMTIELINVIKLLKKNNINVLAFKGPTLAQIAYGNISLRQYSDLDILVNAQDISKAITILEKNNYRLEYQLEEYQKEKLKRSVHDIALYNKKNNIRLECHWTLTSGEFYINIQNLNLFNHPNYIIINNYKLPTLSNETLLVYLCIHGYKHMWERIEWLVDINKLYTNKNLNWKRIIQLSEQLKAKRILLSSLYLCDKLFNTELPKNIKEQIYSNYILNKLSNRILNKITKLYNQNRSYSHSKHLSIIQFYMLENMKSRFLYIITFFKPTEEDYKIFMIPKHLSFLYYFIRPINIFMKKIK